MATVCSSVLALMDGGVPIKEPVAGVAMGLIMESKDNYCILTDILGTEDHLGDMDFKVAGSDEGITAIQMDLKIDGLPIALDGGDFDGDGDEDLVVVRSDANETNVYGNDGFGEFSLG